MAQSNHLVRILEKEVFKLFRLATTLVEFGKIKHKPPVGPHRALICKWCCMGDAVLTLYAIREFNQQFPEIELEVLVSSRIAEVYEKSTQIKQVHILPLTGKNLLLELFHPQLWFDFFSLIFILRKKKFAQFIDLELYRGTGPVLKRILSIPYSRGFKVEGAPPKVHDFEVHRPKDMPEWQCFYSVLGLEIPPLPPPSLYTKSGSMKTNPCPRIGIVYGSSFNWPQKKWPWESYAELISNLSQDGYEFLLLGSPMEIEEGKKITGQAVGKIINSTGTLDYSGLLKEVASCDLIVGNDTGTLHLASAYGIPTVTLFGPTNPKKWNGLTSTPMFMEDVLCRPCYYLGEMPPCDHFSCLRKLTPVKVATQIRTLLPISQAKKSIMR